jgi:hypothetical protein
VAAAFAGLRIPGAAAAFLCSTLAAVPRFPVIVQTMTGSRGKKGPVEAIGVGLVLGAGFACLVLAYFFLARTDVPGWAKNLAFCYMGYAMASTFFTIAAVLKGRWR